MNEILHDLFALMQDRCSGEVESPATRRAFHELDRALDELEDRADCAFRDSVYKTVLRCIVEEQYAAFRLGLRLGIQLHAL